MNVYFVKAQVGLDCVWASHAEATNPADAIAKAKAQQAKDIATAKAHGWPTYDASRCEWSARKSKTSRANVSIR